MAYHTPVLLAECIEGLDIKPEGIYIDLTGINDGSSIRIFSFIEKPSAYLTPT